MVETHNRKRRNKLPQNLILNRSAKKNQAAEKHGFLVEASPKILSETEEKKSKPKNAQLSFFFSLFSALKFTPAFFALRVAFLGVNQLHDLRRLQILRLIQAFDLKQVN